MLNPQMLYNPNIKVEAKTKPIFKVTKHNKSRVSSASREFSDGEKIKFEE